MLFTDSDLVTFSDLITLDGEAEVVAKTMKSVNLTGPRSVTRQAWQECANLLNAQNQGYSSYIAQPGIAAGHYAAVMLTGIAAVTTPRVSLSQIVAHNWRYANALSAIQQWVAYTALRLLYQNASNRLGKDRYEEKMQLFDSRSIEMWSQFRSQGLPAVFKHMEAPGALHGANTGSFTVTGSGAQNAYVVAITYYDGSIYQSQSDKRNAESGPSEIMAVTGDGITVDISGLIPPNGAMPAIGLSEGYTSPLNATHWNIYAGPSADGVSGKLYYQASVPIAVKSYVFNPSTTGPLMQQGQYPDRSLVFGQHLAMRG